MHGDVRRSACSSKQGSGGGWKDCSADCCLSQVGTEQVDWRVCMCEDLKKKNASLAVTWIGSC